MQYSRTNQHHYFDYQMWQDEAAAGDTQRGYADWVEAQIEQTEDEIKHLKSGEPIDRHYLLEIEELTSRLTDDNTDKSFHLAANLI